VKVVIIDDETPARRELRYLLSQVNDVEVVGEAATGTRGLQEIRELRPDVVFLDIQMPGLDGLEVSRILSELPHKPLLIFATAFQEYAVEAFEVDAFDYILKPFSSERVHKSVAKAKKFLIQTPLKAADLLKNQDKKWDSSETAKRIPLFKGEKIIPTPPEKSYSSGVKIESCSSIPKMENTKQSQLCTNWNKSSPPTGSSEPTEVFSSTSSCPRSDSLVQWKLQADHG